MASSRQIELAASTWLARRDAGAWSEYDQAQLDAWLKASTAHRVAFLRLDAAWRQSGRLKALGAGISDTATPARGTWGAPALFERREMEPGSTEASDTQPHRHSKPGRQRIRGAPSGISRRLSKNMRHRLPRYAAVALALLLLASAVGWHRYSAVDQSSYRTVVGGLQDIALADGSKITLGSGSSILVTLSRGERRIDLEQGEAFFRVAKDPGRPFVVSAGSHRAIAVGTRYDVRRDATDLRVIVTQGIVRLESDSGPGGHTQPTTLLPAGSVAVATSTGVVVRSDSVQQAEKLLNWRNGFISFHDTPLTAAVTEFNRYNSRKIVIGDASIGSMRVGGNFRWTNADAFVRLLELGFPIRAVNDDGSIVLKRR